MEIRQLRLPDLLALASRSDADRVTVGLELLRRAERKVARKALKAEKSDG